MKATRWAAAMWPEAWKDGAVFTQGESTNSGAGLTDVGSVIAFAGDWRPAAELCAFVPRKTTVSLGTNGAEVGARAIVESNPMPAGMSAVRSSKSPHKGRSYIIMCAHVFVALLRTKTSNEGRPVRATSDATRNTGPAADSNAANLSRQR